MSKKSKEIKERKEREEKIKKEEIEKNKNKTIPLDNGKYYKGEVQDNIPNGKGKLYNENNYI